MDEIIDEDVRRVMAEEDSPSAPSSFDPTASYDDFFIPEGVNVEKIEQPTRNPNSTATVPNQPVKGEDLGFKDGGYEEIPPPTVI